MGKPAVIYTPRPDSTPEAELDALAACYRYVLFTSQERRGGQNDLTNNTTTKHLGKRTTERTETEKS